MFSWPNCICLTSKRIASFKFQSNFTMLCFAQSHCSVENGWKNVQISQTQWDSRLKTVCTASWSIAYEFHITHVEYGPALIHRNKNAHRTVSTVFHSNSPTVNRCNASHQIHCYTFYFHIYDDQDASHDLQNFRLCCWIISRSVCMEYYPCCIRMMHLSFFEF